MFATHGSAQCVCSAGICQLVAVTVVQKAMPTTQACVLLCLPWEVDQCSLVSWVHFVLLTQGLANHSSSLNLAGQCCFCSVQTQSPDVLRTFRSQGVGCGMGYTHTTLLQVVLGWAYMSDGS